MPELLLFLSKVHNVVLVEIRDTRVDDGKTGERARLGAKCPRILERLAAF